jgi:cellulose biosynthesis protein BcsQ
MSKSLIFPINNKGGIGKTSLLIDLIHTLSLNYKTGIIDSDTQSTMFGTMTGDYSHSGKSSEHYMNLETRTVEIHNGLSFRASKGMKKLRIEVPSHKVKAASFPVGVLYDDFDNGKEKLDRIIKEDMRGIDVLGVDLPPIPHPGLILDHTIIPIIDSLEDTKLFPLIVLTPEKNTIDIGLNEYRLVRNFLIEKGVSEKDIHPIVAMNRVLLTTDNRNRVVFGGLDNQDRTKLNELGMIFDGKVHDEKLSFFDFRNYFKFDGKNIRSVWFPHMDNLRHGDYGFLKENDLGLLKYSQLFQQVNDLGFSQRNYPSELERDYCRQINKLANFVKFHSSKRPKKLFSVYKNSRQKQEAKTKFISNLKTALVDVYSEWSKEECNPQDSYKFGQIHVRYMPNKSLSIAFPTESIPLDILVTAIVETELNLGLERGYIDEGWTRGDRNRILEEIQNPSFGYNNELIDIKSSFREGCLEFEVRNPEFTPRDFKGQLEYFDIFLQYLDNNLAKR